MQMQCTKNLNPGRFELVATLSKPIWSINGQVLSHVVFNSDFDHCVVSTGCCTFLAVTYLSFDQVLELNFVFVRF